MGKTVFLTVVKYDDMKTCKEETGIDVFETKELAEIYVTTIARLLNTIRYKNIKVRVIETALINTSRDTAACLLEFERMKENEG